MAIIESGLIVNGIPLIRSEYYPAEKFVDPYIKTGLFTAIQTLASKAFRDETEEIRFRKYIILIKDLNPEENEPVFLFTVIERGTDISEVKKRLENLAKKMDVEKLILDTPIMINELKELQNQINKEINDLCLKPADRAKYIFG